MAEDSGFTNLGAVLKWIPYFQFTSINVDRSWSEENRDIVVRFLAASIRASQWVADNEDEAVRLAVDKMDVEERYARRAWHDHIQGDALPLDLRLDERSIETALAMIRRDRNASIIIANDATWKKYVDESYLEAAKSLAF